MIKNYILDTNVLLLDPTAISKFDDNNVIIPIGVIEELDKFKKDQTELGKNARQVSRSLDILRHQGDLGKGVNIAHGKLRVCYNGNLNSFYKESNVDLHVLHVAQEIAQKESGIECIIISRDINVRIRANALGLKAESYEGDQIPHSEIDQGYSEVTVSNIVFEQLAETKKIDVKDVYADHKLMPNHYLVVQRETDLKKSLLARVDSNCIYVKRLISCPPHIGLVPKNKEQAFVVDALMDDNIKLVCIAGKAGSGKAQPLSADVLTPNGFIKMGDLEEGDLISTPDGNCKKIKSIHPQGEIDVYKVSFSDRTSTLCSYDHLWETKTSLDRDHGRKASVKTTKEIHETLFYGKLKKKNHSIQITAPLNFVAKNAKLDPYLLGVLLGDGCIKSGCPMISSNDQFIVDRCNDIVEEYGLSLKYAGQYDYRISGKNNGGGIKRRIESISKSGEVEIFNSIQGAEKRGYCKSAIYRVINGKQKYYKSKIWIFKDEDIELSNNKLKSELMSLQLWGCGSENKFIPHNYKYNDVNSRIKLLRGLMDTDGCICKNQISYCTISRQLMEDVRFLVESLGGICYLRSRNTKYTDKFGKKRYGKLSYELNIVMPNNINPFLLPRKSNAVVGRIKYLPIRYIVGIEKIGKEKSQCIYIDDNKHLYMTNNCIVTHNTILSVAIGYHLMLEKRYQRLLVSRPVFPMGKDIGFLPGEIEDKLDPWMTPIYDAFDVIKQDKSMRGRDLVDGVNVVVEPLSYIRGRSIRDQFLIIDESQNLTSHEIKTIVTRAGENTKVVLTGDIYQIDNPYIDSLSNGLSVAVTKMKSSKLVANMVLERGVRSELAEEAANKL